MPKYLDLELELLDVPGPRATRRFLLAERATFFDLHRAIQDAVGWRDSHLFAFRSVNGAPIASSPADPDPDAEDAKDMRVTRLLHDEFLRCCLYNYDYGDDWWVFVRDNERVRSDEKFFRRLIAGQAGWAPDDCGGPPGFKHIQDTYAERTKSKSRRKAQEDSLEWTTTWRPDFDLDEAKKAFDSARKPKDRY